jgi:hypothetical protein
LDFRHIFELKTFKGLHFYCGLVDYSSVKPVSGECFPFLKIFPKNFKEAKSLKGLKGNLGSAKKKGIP